MLYLCVDCDQMLTGLVHVDCSLHSVSRLLLHPQRDAKDCGTERCHWLVCRSVSVVIFQLNPTLQPCHHSSNLCLSISPPGFLPRLVKVAPACAIMISTYEFGKAFFHQHNQERMLGPVQTSSN